MKLLLAGSVLIAVVAVVLRSTLFQARHSEAALLVDWSDPPPLPVFVGVNVLAGLLRSMADALTPPPIRMLDIGVAYHTTILAYICEKFSVPDYLATGPKTVQEIAAHMQTADVDRVERLMYALAAEGMTQLEKKSPDPMHPRFVNTALSATLRSDHPTSMRGFVGHNVEDLWPVWGDMADLFGPNARANCWDSTWPEFPVTEHGIWKYYEANPAQEEQFGRAMSAVEGLGGKAMALDGPFSKFRRVVDVGGSLGHFLYKVLAVNPEMKGVLFDRPPVLENAEKLWNRPDGVYHDERDRIALVEGDFFDVESIPEPQDGDAYYMRYILHDWLEEDVLRILRNLRQRFGDRKVTLLIGESAIPDRDRVGVPATMYHIDMQMMAVFGGAKDRTPAEWEDTLSIAGFELVAIHPTRSLVHWVEAVPKQ